MISVAWPNMFGKTITNTNRDNDATLQNLKLLLQYDFGELMVDPGFGTDLVQFLYDPNDAIALDLAKDAIYTAIAKFMPQIKVTRDDITLTSNGTTIVADIRAYSKIDYTTNLYTIPLVTNMVEGD